MADIISQIQFRNAVPFAYMFFSLMLLIVALVCLIVIGVSVWKRKYGSLKSIISVLVLALIGVYAYSGFIYSNNLNLNPFFKEQQLVGRWGAGDATLLLSEGNSAEIAFDEKYIQRTGLESGMGTWNKSDKPGGL